MAADPRLTPHGHLDRPECLNTVRIRVGQLVEALRYTPEGLGFDSRWCWGMSEKFDVTEDPIYKRPV
jgi:hypothetical protein